MDPNVKTGNSSSPELKLNKENKRKEPLLLTRLKEYKDLIALVVFFVCGVIWIYSIFATEKLVTELDCITNKNILLSENRLKREIITSQVLDINAEQNLFILELKDGSTDDKEKLHIEQRIRSWDDKIKKAEEDIASIDKKNQIIQEKIQFGGCK